MLDLGGVLASGKNSLPVTRYPSWKMGRVDPLQKPGKDLSYPVANHQHGFHPQHSRGLNPNKPSHNIVLVALNLSKAFDIFNYATLFEVERTALRSSFKR